MTYTLIVFVGMLCAVAGLAASIRAAYYDSESGWRNSAMFFAASTALWSVAATLKEYLR